MLLLRERLLVIPSGQYHAGVRYCSGLMAAFLIAILFCGVAVVIAQEVSIKILVNDEPISDYDIDQRERFLAITTQQQPSPALKKQAADMLIDERLQFQEGRKASISPAEEDVTAILTDMAQKNNLNVQGLTEALADGELRDVFTSQFVENRGHINMGRRIVEECVSKPFEAELCRWACGIARRDYGMFLQELSDLVLGRETVVEARTAPLRIND